VNQIGLAQEMAVLTKMNHMNIIKLQEIIDDPESKKVYLIMDYCQGGTLLEKLEKSKAGLEESLVKKYFRCLISAVHYCNEVHNVSHRDIKPENIMLHEDGEVFLCDFGCSEFFTPSTGTLSKATKGTYLFMAPEMFLTGPQKVIYGR
jgi:serine/threonine protein kinase